MRLCQCCPPILTLITSNFTILCLQVVVPLSVLPNWMAEFKRFAPEMRIVRIHVNDEGGWQTAPLLLRRGGRVADCVVALRLADSPPKASMSPPMLKAMRMA